MAVVAAWQARTWVPTGLDLTKRPAGITLRPDPGTVDAAAGRCCDFDDIALVDDGTAAPSSDCLTLAGDSIQRCALFTVGLWASF